MVKRGTDDIRDGREPEDEQTFKVRVSITLAHYVLVSAKNQDDAEQKTRDYVKKLDKEEGFAGWYNEASHINSSFEVEEA